MGKNREQRGLFALSDRGPARSASVDLRMTLKRESLS